MDLKLHQLCSLSQEIDVELDVWVDAHTSTPDKHLIILSESHAMTVAKADVFHCKRAPFRPVTTPILKEDLLWSLDDLYQLVLNSKLALLVPAPCEYGSFSC